MMDITSKRKADPAEHDMPERKKVYYDSEDDVSDSEASDSEDEASGFVATDEVINAWDTFYNVTFEVAMLNSPFDFVMGMTGSEISALTNRLDRDIKKMFEEALTIEMVGGSWDALSEGLFKGLDHLLSSIKDTGFTHGMDAVETEEPDVEVEELYKYAMSHVEDMSTCFLNAFHEKVGERLKVLDE